MRNIGRLLLLCLAFLSLGTKDVLAGEVVITNPRREENDLSITTVRAIFFMRLTQWRNSDAITVFVLPSNNAIHEKFTKNVLNVFPYQYQSALDRLVFSGTGQAPVVVTTPEQLREFVAKTPGGIGYINEGMINGSVKRVKIRPN